MFRGTIVNIDILVGLPGSGKSYYAESIAKTEREKRLKTPYNYGKDLGYFKVIDFDKYRNNYPKLDVIFKKEYAYNDIFLYNSNIHLIFDGLFCTAESQMKIVEEWVDLFKKKENRGNGSKTNFRFIYFIEDREACLNNDSYRSEERSAKYTIKNMLLNKPNIEEFKEKFDKEEEAEYNQWIKKNYKFLRRFIKECINVDCYFESDYDDIERIKARVEMNLPHQLEHN